MIDIDINECLEKENFLLWFKYSNCRGIIEGFKQKGKRLHNLVRKYRNELRPVKLERLVILCDDKSRDF